MKEGRNILGWLGLAESESALIEATKHVEETCKTVAWLQEAVGQFIGGNLSQEMIAIEKCKESERAADKLRNAIVQRLSEGLLLPPDREDLMRFAKALDKIADTTNRAARLLGMIEAKLPENVLKNLAISTEIIVNAVGALRSAIHAMRANKSKEVFESCEEVERLEHTADDQKRTMLDAVLHGQLEPGTLLLTYNLAEALEAITDRIDTASDMIKMLVVKSR